VFRSPEAVAAAPAYPDAEEVIRAVRKAGGIIALAHPGEKGLTKIPLMVEWGLNGIETDHPDIPEERQPLCLEAAEHFGLYRCGGTDHTGPMSCVPGKHAYFVENGISEGDFRILKERRLG
jgi:predicted metal-dependent phosphoesterase TrpH